MIWRRVLWRRPVDVSELNTTFSAMMMEAKCSSKTSEILTSLQDVLSWSKVAFVFLGLMTSNPVFYFISQIFAFRKEL